MNTHIKHSMQLGLAALFIGAAIVPACAQKFIQIKPRAPKRPPMTGTAGVVVYTPKTPVVSPTAARAAATAAASATPNLVSSINKALNTNVERRLIQGISTHAVNASAYEVKPASLNVRVLPEIGTPYLNITLQQVRDFLNMHNRFDRGTSTLERINATFERTDKIFFVRKRDGYYLNDAVAKNVTYDEVWHLLVQDTGFNKREKEPFVDVDFSKTEIDGVNIHDWILAKHQELRANSTWYDRFAIWSDASVGTKSNPVLPVLKFRQQQIQYALGQLQNAASVWDDTTIKTAEEIQFLLENLSEDNPLRRDIENTLRGNGYITE